MYKVTLGLLLLSTAVHAHFDQSLFELNKEEVNYRTNMLWDKDAETLKAIIAVWSSRMGPESLGIAQYSSKLGTALIRTGDYAGAEQALRSALSILEANGPLYDEAATTVKRKLVKALIEQNKAGEAEQLKNSLPPIHPTVPNDTKPQLISKQDPQYTKAAAAKDVSGSISISLTVDEKGHVKDLHVIEPLGFGLDENAIKAVSKWKFKPAMGGGIPVSSTATVEVSFRRM